MVLTVKVEANSESFHIFLKVCALLAVFSSANFDNNGQQPVIGADFQAKSLKLSQDPEEFCGIQQQPLSYSKNNYSWPLAQKRKVRFLENMC